MPDSTGASPVCRSRRGAGSSRSAGRGPKAMGSKRSGYRDEGLTRRVTFPVKDCLFKFPAFRARHFFQHRPCPVSYRMDTAPDVAA
jgi:hypothetical protein